MSNTTIIKKFDFAAAHRLIETVTVGHPCSNLHGHNYECKLEINTSLNRDMIIDFSKLKVAINCVLVWFDHKTILNSKDSLETTLRSLNQKIFKIVNDPTVENMTFCMGHLLMHELNSSLDFSKVKSFTLYMSETMNSIGAYTWNQGDKQCRIVGKEVFYNEDIICYL